MKTTLNLKFISETINDLKFLNHTIPYSVKRAIDENDFEPNNSVQIDLSELSESDCKLLESKMIEKKYNLKSINTVSNWIKNIKNPKNAVITSLQMFEKVLSSLLKESKSKWVLIENPDGMIVPCAVSSVKYKGRTRDDEALVLIQLNYVSITSTNRWSEDVEIKKEKITKTIYFYKSNISDLDESEFNDFYDEDEKQNNKNKKNGYLLTQILSSKNILLMDDDYIKTYEKDVFNANQVSKKIGKVYTCEGKGFIIPDSKSGLSGWKDLNDDTKTNKIVVDELKSNSTTYSTNGDLGTIDIPEHPYILTYDITSFRYSVVHVNNIVEYQYNDKILDKLVINDKTKKVLSSLIGSKNNFEDLITGKSGGIVILSTGESGLGKTLTAEVYSEVMKKPLYCVQSSQLGINVSDIEKNLNKILNRAEKWDAVLLIDEADSYIYKRGNDILQNCIVGTFLRLMEYYNGILFLTSNRPEIIDDAIMSRVTLHIKYKLPTYEEFCKLWNILCENFKLKISNENINRVWEKYEPFSGRDIRNTLKDISKCFPKEKEVTFEMIKELEDFLPFIKNKN